MTADWQNLSMSGDRRFDGECKIPKESRSAGNPVQCLGNSGWRCAYLLVSEWQARHLGIALEVAAHVDREYQVDMAGSLVGINKLVLVVLLQINGQNAGRSK